MSIWLRPTPFVDSDAPGVMAFARAAAGGDADPLRRAVALYYAVRDGVTYTPYCDFQSADTYRASAVLTKGAGFCVGKAALLVAAARAEGIPARLRFADVRNHLCTPRLRALMGGDVFYYHGYVELELGGRWVKATPAFDRALCDRFGVLPLEFDGREDSIFHPYDRAGRRHMEYLRDRGAHADVPVDDIAATFAREYPRLTERDTPAPAARFREEAGETALDEVRQAQRAWESRQARTPDAGAPDPRGGDGIAVGDHGLHTPAPVDYLRDLGFPGEYPFTRGIYPSMYRGRVWTMRQYAGFGTAAETNRRFRYMLERGLGGLNVAFDLPTQHGYDSDHPRARGEVGKVGVPVDSLRDLEIVFDGIPLEEASPANAINAPAAVILAMYVALAEQQGLPLDRLAGSTQNDILKEFIARGTYIFPPVPSLRLVTDVIEYCSERLPRWNFINVCGYHLREAGSTLVQEVGFALADAVTYVQAAVARGLPVDRFAPRFAFNFTVGTDILQEAAKFRAMRRLWARIMRERFGATTPASCALRTGAGSGASQLTAQQPENNIVRVTLNSIAAILGGAQSLHTAAYDEALALPTERSVKLALRTQQILAHESGLADVIDPLAGSYYVEALTNEIEAAARALIDEVERRGGMVAAIGSGWVQQQIADAAWEFQRRVEAGERVIVGVNRHVEEAPWRAEIHRHAEEAAGQQIAALAALRAARDAAAVRRALDRVEAAAAGGANLLPVLIDAVKVYATVGEICDVLRGVFGEHQVAQVY